MASDKAPAPMTAAAFMASRTAAATAVGAFPARINASGSVLELRADIMAAVRYCAGLPKMAKIDSPAKRDAAVMSECANRLNAAGYRPSVGPVNLASKDSRPYWTGLSLAVLVRDLAAV